jgi:hypothetical protein
LRADAFDHANFGAEVHGHWLVSMRQERCPHLYIIPTANILKSCRKAADRQRRNLRLWHPYR